MPGGHPDDPAGSNRDWQNDRGEVIKENNAHLFQDAFLPAQPVELIYPWDDSQPTCGPAQLLHLSIYNPARDELQIIRHIKVEIQLGSDFTHVIHQTLSMKDHLNLYCKKP